ncbi:glycosyltransferase family 2 protein [Pleomorphochaeta sp. DL1XJH-081]|uniref:glycosyltransferase family 2 protein n=1 Tax=Pleomorphochaeta sp. DL1XJH-081 TaxID=3409690 RepID=UPI003BB53A15
MSKVAVLIPCFNEELTIGKVINDFRRTLPEADIYVYDNNSTDATVSIARSAGAIVRYEHNQGKGNVMRRMFREIEADCYVIVDGDDTYPADNAKQMVDYILNENYDMIIGDRLSSTYFSENKRAFHNFGNVLVRKIINYLFKSDIHDVMTGYRAFSKTFIKGFPILARGFEIETEMTIHAVDKNFAIKEIPIEYRDRPHGSVSKLRTYTDGAKVLGTIFNLFMDYRPLVFFGVTSLIFLVMAVILFLPVFIEYLETGIVERFPTLIVSVTFGICFLLSISVGIILKVIGKKHKQLYMILMNNIKSKHL